MLTEEEIQEAEKLSKKSEVVQKLLDFWGKAQVDGRSALRIALNNKLLEISNTIDAASVGDNADKTFERIDKIVAALNKLPDENAENKVKVNDKHKDRVVI